MNRGMIFGLSAMTVLLGMSAGAVQAQTAKDLVGTWQLVSTVNTAANGTKKTDTYGPHGKGIAIFGANGHFVIVNTNPDIPKIASNNRLRETPAENKTVAEENLAYFGTYSVTDKVITEKVEGSSYPNWIGTDQKRTIVSLAGDELKYDVAAPAQGGQNETSFKRIK